MKKAVLLGVLVSLAVVATAFLLIRHRIPYLTTRQTAAHAGTPDADWRDAKLWSMTPEYKVVMDELHQIGQAGDAWDNLTSDEVEALIVNIHSPHYEARALAAIFSGGKYPAPVRAKLLPHVLGLLSDPVSDVRFWAADALGSMGDKSVIPRLKPLLKDRPAVAKVAQKAILKLQGEETAPEK